MDHSKTLRTPALTIMAVGLFMIAVMALMPSTEKPLIASGPGLLATVMLFGGAISAFGARRVVIFMGLLITGLLPFVVVYYLVMGLRDADRVLRDAPASRTSH